MLSAVMAKQEEGKVDKEAKLAALMMSGLVMTAADELADFRRRRLGPDSMIDLDHLRRAREVALSLVEAISADDESKWALVQAAWALFDQESVADDEPTTLNKGIVNAIASAAEAPPSRPQEAPPASQSTAILSSSEPAVGRLDAALPFTKPPATQPTPAMDAGDLAEVRLGTPALTLAQYAALCAACGALPDRVHETHAKFGLPDAAAREELDSAWQQHFDTDPNAHHLWQVLLKQFRAWLVQYGGV